jgi:hypothetical protein
VAANEKYKETREYCDHAHADFESALRSCGRDSCAISSVGGRVNHDLSFWKELIYSSSGISA